MQFDTKFDIGGLVSTVGKLGLDIDKRERETFRNKKVVRVDIFEDEPDGDGLIQYTVEGVKGQYLEHELKDASFCAECGSELTGEDVEHGARNSEGDLLCIDCKSEAELAAVSS